MTKMAVAVWILAQVMAYKTAASNGELSGFPILTWLYKILMTLAVTSSSADCREGDEQSENNKESQYHAGWLVLITDDPCLWKGRYWQNFWWWNNWWLCWEINPTAEVLDTTEHPFLLYMYRFFLLCGFKRYCTWCQSARAAAYNTVRLKQQLYLAL